MYAFQLAERRRSHVAGATKSNGINFSMPFWDEVFNEVGEEYPHIRRELVHVDALAARFIKIPRGGALGLQAGEEPRKRSPLLPMGWIH